MEKIKFNVEVNPFAKQALVTANIAGVQHSTTVDYQELDEWNSFTFGEKTFDIHFLYDTKFFVSIYSVENNEADYRYSFDVNITFKMED